MKGKPSPRNRNRSSSSRRVTRKGDISRKNQTTDEASTLPWEAAKMSALRKECTRPVEQEVLQREWERLGVEQKAVRRAQRARRGERCSECGCVGYFRRNCPTCPPVRFDVKTGGWQLLSEEEIRGINNRRCAKTTSLSSGAGPNRRHIEGSDGGCEVDGHLQGVPPPSRGFLWGPLADDAAHPATGIDDGHDDRRQCGVPAASEKCGAASGGVALVAEMPSLSGTSDLSSGVISGFRRALVGAEDSGAPLCPSVVSSLKDAFEGPGQQFGGDSTASKQSHQHSRARHACLHTGVSEINCSSRSNDDGDGDAGAAVTGVAAADLESNANSIAGRSGGVGGDGGAIDDCPRTEQELTWRWPDFCNETALQSPWSPGGGEHCKVLPSKAGKQVVMEPPSVGPANQTHAHSITSAGGGHLAKATTSSSPPPLPPRGSYLRLRDNMVLTVQENLHLALARLIEATQRQAHSVTSLPSAAEILQSPKGGSPPERYYRPSTRKDFRDFFDAEEDEECRRQQPKAHTYLGGLREEGKLKYVFDRTSHARKGSLAAHLWGDYQPQPRGYRGTNVHSVVAWRRPNTVLDRYASSGRETIRRVALSDKALRRQFVWVGEHKKAREQRRQRADHLLEVLRMELLEEQKREIEVLRLPRREQHFHVAEAMKGRLLAADRIIRTLRRYGLMENIEDAHYIIYTLNAARRAGLAKKERRQVHISRPSSYAGDMTASTPGVGAMVGASGAGAAGGERSKYSGTAGLVPPEDSHGDSEISPYSLPLRPAALPRKTRLKIMEPSKRRSTKRFTGDERYATGKEGNLADQDTKRRHQRSEQLRTFRLAGYSVRRGVEDDTTAVPALIPIPKAFGSGKVSESEHKSFAAGRMMEALRAGQIDPNTGRCANVTVPLWHRATEEIDSSTAGSVLYSDLIGHTYSVLVGPRRVGKDKRNDNVD